MSRMDTLRLRVDAPPIPSFKSYPQIQKDERKGTGRITLKDLVTITFNMPREPHQPKNDGTTVCKEAQQRDGNNNN